jgi:hypothetical protein
VEYNLLGIDISDSYDNTYLISVLAKFLEFPQDVLEKQIEQVFKRKGEDVIQKNKQIFSDIFDNYILSFENPFGKIHI